MKAVPGSLWMRLRVWMSCWAAGRATNGLSIAARLDLGAKKSLLVVEYGKRRFLVGVGAETIGTMIEFDEARRWERSEVFTREILRGSRRRTRAQEICSKSTPAQGELLLKILRGKR